MNSRWTQLANKYLSLSERRPKTILAVALAVALVGLSLAQRLQIDASLEALLPEDTPALPALAQMAQRIPGSSPLYLLVSSDDPALTRRLSHKITNEVSKWPETVYAMDRRDPTYFLDRRLLFLPAKDLTDLAYQVEDIVDFEECAAIPGCVNLDTRPPTPQGAELRRKLEQVPEVRALLGLFGTDKLPEQDSPEHNANTALTPTPPDHDADKSRARLGDLCNPDGTVCAIQVILDGTPSDLDFAVHILNKSQKLFDEVRPQNAPQSLKLATSGRYRNAPMSKKMVVNDLRNTASLSTLLMVLLVLAQFRGGRAFVLIFVPLLCAGAWSVGVIALIHPKLNVISAFTLAVLAGLGIDFGVHLLTQYGTERKTGASVSGALKRTFSKLGGPMGVACVTSACGFGALTAAQFRGFAEMGALAALGVLFALLAFLLLFAPLVHVCKRISPEAGPIIRTYKFRQPHVRNPMRLFRGITTIGILLGIFAGIFGSQVDFEYDFRKLTPKRVGHGIRWGEAMHSTTRLSVIMMADNPAELERTAASLRKAHPEHDHDEQPWMLTPSSFVPSNQSDRIEAIGKLRSAFNRAHKRLSKEEREELSYITPLLGIEKAITPEDLPRWVREWLSERNGQFGTFGLLYSTLRGSDAKAMEQLADEVSQLQAEYPQTLFASAEALLGVVVPGLRGDAPTMVGLALLGLFFSTLLIGKSFTRTLTVLAPLALGTCLSLALMVAFDLKINLYNMLVFPLSFGIGIDGAVYIVWAMSKFGKDTAAEVSVTARGVLGSTVTTAAGFGSMAVANNPGLVSLGLLAIITLSCSLVANLIWLPALMYIRSAPRRSA